MSQQAAITVLLPRAELERRWGELRPDTHGTATFKDAPGDRGTEIHVETDEPAKAKDALRRFKQLVETGEIARSEGTPEGELAERKLKQRPAQPLDAAELEKAGI